MVQIIKTARGGITTYHGEDAGRTFPHVGIDIGHGNMTDHDRRMVAPAAGSVTAAGWSGTYGNRVIITHDDGTWSLIAHMDTLAISVGDYVQQGQQIGVMGRTGGPWGSIAGWFVHGHQEYHLANGTAVNPLDYLGATAGGNIIDIGDDMPLTEAEWARIDLANAGANENLLKRIGGVVWGAELAHKSGVKGSAREWLLNSSDMIGSILAKPSAAFDPAKLAAELQRAGVTGTFDEASLVKALDASLRDDFAAIPGAVRAAIVK